MENQSQLRDELWNRPVKLISRRELLPWWMKICCWFFMFTGVGSIFATFYGWVDSETDLSIYGLESDEPFSVIGMTIVAIMVYKGYVAWALWFEKDGAIGLGKVDALAGMALCVIAMILTPLLSEDNSFSFRLEIVPLVAFYTTLGRIENAWNTQKDAEAHE